MENSLGTTDVKRIQKSGFDPDIVLLRIKKQGSDKIQKNTYH